MQGGNPWFMFCFTDTPDPNLANNTATVSIKVQ
jgi:hypothetical protein